MRTRLSELAQMIESQVEAGEIFAQAVASFDDAFSLRDREVREILTIKLIPADLMAEFRASAALRSERPTSKAGLAFIIVVWLSAATFTAMLLYRWKS